jgi:hypothetical protein
MKKVFHTLLFAMIASSCFSQIPNNGFENWTSMGIYDNLVSWGTLNNTTALDSIFTATKSAPGSPGSYYLNLTSKTIGGVAVNGIAVSGVLDSITLLPRSGFALSAQPQKFTGKWQHMLYGTSAGSVSVLLSKWNTGLNKRDTVATAMQSLSGMVMSWAAFSINFTYQSSAIPDSCIIILKASGVSPTAGDYLWVDNLAFSGSVAGVSESADQNTTLNIFPNPANNEIEFSNSKNINKGDLLIISDMLGNEIFRKKIIESSFKINSSNFANGTFICKLINSYGVQYSINKFTIQH